MQIVIMLVLLVAVIAVNCGMLFMFFRKLNVIEEELWGDKRREAEKTAKADYQANQSSESDTNATEH